MVINTAIKVLGYFIVISIHQGHPNPLEGIQPAVKAALTRAYKEGSKSRMVRAADLISLPGMKKAPKKRIAAILEPSDDGLVDGSGELLAENEEENSSDAEELGKPLHLTRLTCTPPPLPSKIKLYSLFFGWFLQFQSNLL